MRGYSAIFNAKELVHTFETRIENALLKSAGFRAGSGRGDKNDNFSEPGRSGYFLPGPSLTCRIFFGMALRMSHVLKDVAQKF